MAVIPARRIRLRPTLAVRLLLVLVFAALLAPLQFVAVRFRWRLGGRLPVFFHRLLLRLLRIRVTAIGTPPGPDLPTLVLSNHVSWLDIPILGAATPLSFVAKSEVAGWPVVGTLARLQRCIFLERARKAATAEVNTAVAHRLAAGDVMVLFPEGTTGDGIRLLPFRSSIVGAAKSTLASAESVRLQPLAIAYRARRGLPVTRREMPDIAWYGDTDLAPHVIRFLEGGPIDVVLAWGEPVPFTATSDRKAATVACERAVRDSLERGKNPSVLAGDRKLHEHLRRDSRVPMKTAPSPAARGTAKTGETAHVSPGGAILLDGRRS